MTQVLITGGAGCIGSHFCEAVQATTDWHMHLICTFNHRGDKRRLAALDPKRYTLHMHDLSQPIPLTMEKAIGSVEHIFHFAAESHVDRSLDDPVPFIRNNVDVTLNMLEYARENGPRLFFQISTDEVYGPAPDGTAHKEWDAILPSNPYSASKAAQEAIAISYWRSYGVPVVITNTMNNFCERQDVEKFVPKTLRAVLRGEKAIVHGSPGDIGSRFYMHARNHADALLWLTKWEHNRYPIADRPSRFNIVGDREMNNLEMAQMIAKFAGKPLEYELVDAHSQRPGHDRRYALDGSLLHDMGWRAPVPFEESLERTIKWTMVHPEWLGLDYRVKSWAMGEDRL